MLSDNIVLFEINGYFVLIDNYTLNMFLLNESTFAVLKEMKSGGTRKEAEIRFGKNKVDKIFEYINKMIEKGKICFLSKRKFFNAQTIIEEIKPKQPMLVEGVFMIAQECNMCCKYCYGSSGQFNNSSIMSREMAEQFFLLFLKNSGDIKHQKVKFMGGEPLLNFSTIKHIVDFWENIKIQFPGRKVTFSFTTNGTLFTPEIIEYVKEKQIGVTVSLDGPITIQNSNRKFSDGTDTFVSVIKGIKLLEQNNIKFTIRSTATSDTDLNELFDYFKEHNYSLVNIIPVDFPLKTKQRGYQWDFLQFKNFVNKEQELLLNGYEDIAGGNTKSFNAKMVERRCESFIIKNLFFPFKCSAGWCSAAFSTDGYIYPCQRMVGKDKYRIGDYKKGIYEKEIKSIYLKVLEKSEKCNSCIAFISCKRRCLAQMAQDNGEIIEISDELCDIYRNEFKETLLLYLQHQKRK
ncbi:MAG: radical SAM protein [Lachnospiraceae bacterium]